MQSSTPLNRPLQIILTIVAAVIIVALVILISRAVMSPEPTPVAEIGATEQWPTPRASASQTTSPTSPAPPTSTATSTPTPTPTLVPTPTPIVIGSFEELGNLVTVQYTLQTVVEVERGRIFPLSSERIILVAVGNVEAGIDLSQIQDDDIIIDGSRVKITLPPAAVTSVELLPGESEVFDSNRGWLLSEYEGLELEAMDKARSQLEDWARERVHVLDQAEAQAEQEMETFLSQLGFEEIEITFEK